MSRKFDVNIKLNVAEKKEIVKRRKNLDLFIYLTNKCQTISKDNVYRVYFTWITIDTDITITDGDKIF